MTVTLKVDKITSDLKRRQKLLDQVPDRAFDFWYKETPIRTGNARRRTHLRGNTIEARYPYAQRLDEGYSRQSPEGMSRPTERFIQRLVRTIMRK